MIKFTKKRAKQVTKQESVGGYVFSPHKKGTMVSSVTIASNKYMSDYRRSKYVERF